jgi:hypothetical protein
MCEGIFQRWVLTESAPAIAAAFPLTLGEREQPWQAILEFVRLEAESVLRSKRGVAPPKNWERFSLSPSERAGRGETTLTIDIL